MPEVHFDHCFLGSEDQAKHTVLVAKHAPLRLQRLSPGRAPPPRHAHSFFFHETPPIHTQAIQHDFKPQRPAPPVRSGAGIPESDR